MASLLTALWASHLLAIPFLPGAALPHPDPEPGFQLDVAVTTDEDGAAADRPWIDRQVALAEGVFGPLAVHLSVDQVRNLDAELSHVDDLAMRDRFASLVAPGRIQVFVVRSLQDSAQPGVYRRGVTWNSRTVPRRRFLIVSADAAPSTLAHELGHYFGIRAHSHVKNNLMSYDRQDSLVFLDPAQQAIVRSVAEKLRGSEKL